MDSKYNYKVYAAQIHKPTDNVNKHSNSSAIFFIVVLTVVGLFAVSTETKGGVILGLFAASFAIAAAITIANNNENFAKAKAKIQGEISLAESQQKSANSQAELYSQKLNSLLSKSDEIVNYILPNYQSLAQRSIEIAKNDYRENAFSPFWSKIEDASNSLAYYKEALTQLCLNSELYAKTLRHLNHNFPIPFPFSTNISISETIDDYKTITRKAHTHPTFSIIWEQRRNTQVLIGGFKTLEDAIFNMSNDLYGVINDLKTSIKSNFDEMKYLQNEQVETIRQCEATLNYTLNNMDNKLYYIQWKRKPLEKFQHR